MPYISKAGSSSSNTSSRPFGVDKFTFCPHCGGQTFYWPTYHGLYCNRCGTLEDDSDKLKAQLEAEKLQQEATFEMADGSDVFSPEAYSHSRLRTGKTFGIGTGKTRTINMKDAITDKLRYQDGRTKEIDDIFKAQDRQLESSGRTIISDKVVLRKSDNITSSDEMRAEKGLGHVNS